MNLLNGSNGEGVDQPIRDELSDSEAENWDPPPPDFLSEDDLVEENNLQQESEEEKALGQTFSPPLYLQRYNKALEILSDERWIHVMSRVVDLGCAECRFLGILKRLPWVREIVGVDIDEALLQECRRRTEPLFIDYLEQRPFTPIDMYLMAGSVADRDERLKDVDAVTAIELIEHLHPDVLSEFPKTIFGFARPKLVIITTPNQEYNVRFKTFEGPFRHWDHKFEWTRSEFESWSHVITESFPDYNVSFFGIGSEPQDGKDTGDCSQGAIFIRKDFESSANNGECQDEADPSTRNWVSTSDSIVGPYKEIEHHRFPFKRDDRTLDEKIWSEANYLMNNIARTSSEWLEMMPTKISLSFMVKFSNLQKYDVTTEQLSEVLHLHSCHMEMDEDEGEMVLVPYVPDDEPSDDDEPSNDDEPSDDDDLYYDETGDQEGSGTTEQVADLPEVDLNEVEDLWD